MPRQHVVRQGECFATIAAQHGFRDLADLYDHPRNEDLRRLRTNPHVLAPGDIVFIPDSPTQSPLELRARAENRFVARPRYRLRLDVRDPAGGPAANRRYRMDLDGRIREGRLDGSGRLDEPIFTRATVSQLTVWFDDERDGYTWTLEVGHLDPIGSLSGVRDRLRNLGLDCGDESGDDDGPRTRDAIERFQRAQGVAPTGQLDDDLRALLERTHGV